MPTFYIYFDGIFIDTLQNSTARKARNYVNRRYAYGQVIYPALQSQDMVCTYI